MKKLYKIYLLVLLIPIVGFSNNDDAPFAKTKTIKKAYFVNTDAGINIDNAYGSIYVTTWDEDKIELDITIKVSGGNENWVNQRINDIDVDINALKNLVSAKTIIKNSNTRSKGNNNTFEINYTIKIPKKGNVTLRNKYGNIITTDLWSTTDLTCKYGKLSTGKLNSNKNNIQIEYCPGSSIEYVNYGSILARYSEIKINDLSKIDLTSDYTDVTVANGDVIRYTSKYGNLNIFKVKSVEGTANYMTLKFGDIFEQFKLTAKYCEISVNNFNPKVNDVVIISGYSGIKLGYNPIYAFDFDISVRYANLKSDSDLVFSDREETNYSKTFRGYYNKKGVNNLTIKSDYGNIILSKK